MGVELVYELPLIGNNVGFYLFGESNFPSSGDQQALVVPGGLSLPFLAEVLGRKYPQFPGQVERISELYQPVMDCVEPLAKYQMAHQNLDAAVQELVGRHLALPDAKKSFIRKMQERGEGLLSARLAMVFGTVPETVLEEYVAETIGYSDNVMRARGYLESQLALLDGACDEVAEFQQLLTGDIAQVASEIMAKNEIQLYFIEQGKTDGFERAKELSPYVRGAISIMPSLCQRRKELREVLFDPARDGKYIKDDLSGLSLRLKNN